MKRGVQTLLVFFAGFGTHAWLVDKPQLPKPERQARVALDSDVNANQETAQRVPSSNSARAFDTQTRRDYPEVLTELLTDRDDPLVKARISLLVGQWALEAPAPALDFLAENGLNDHFEMVMVVAGKQADEQVLSWLNKHSSRPNSHYWFDSYFRSMAKVTPARAIELVRDSAFGKDSARVLSAIIDEWAATDANAALNWLQDSDLGANETSSLRRAVLLRYASQDPWQAATLYTSLASLDDQRELLSQVALGLSSEDMSLAVDWADSLPDHHQKHAMAALVGNWLINAEPGEVLDYLTIRADTLHQQSILKTSIAGIAAREPSLLLTRLDEFPDTIHTMVIQEATIGLSNATNDDVSELIEGVKSDSLRDFAWERMTENTINGNPSKAYELAQKIANDGQRNHYLGLTVRAWAQRDVTAAINAIKSSAEWTEPQKQALLDNIRRGQ